MILVFSEGEKTEKFYLREFSRACRDTCVVRLDKDHAVPKTLVERAADEVRRKKRSKRSESAEWDEIWCVFDVDAHPNLPDARQQAQAHGICLAISNPCFELWALLHFQDQNAYLERDDAKRLLRKHLPHYEKELPYDRLAPLYADAIRRAFLLDRMHEGVSPAGSNPSTGIPALLRSITAK